MITRTGWGSAPPEKGGGALAPYKWFQGFSATSNPKDLPYTQIEDQKYLPIVSILIELVDGRFILGGFVRDPSDPSSLHLKDGGWPYGYMYTLSEGDLERTEEIEEQLSVAACEGWLRVPTPALPDLFPHPSPRCGRYFGGQIWEVNYATVSALTILQALCLCLHAVPRCAGSSGSSRAF